jgi:hypothetical protein
MAHEFDASVMEKLIRELYNIPPDVVAAATDAIAEGEMTVRMDRTLPDRAD